MNPTTWGLLMAIEKAPRQFGYAAECKINVLGVEWTASIDFDAACYDGDWFIDEYLVEIIPVGREAADQWITIDESELPEAAFRDIEAACMRELEGREQGDPDADDDRAKDLELDSHLENMADKGRER